jgi:hypothetical protein
MAGLTIISQCQLHQPQRWWRHAINAVIDLILCHVLNVQLPQQLKAGHVAYQTIHLTGDSIGGSLESNERHSVEDAGLIELLVGAIPVISSTALL